MEKKKEIPDWEKRYSDDDVESMPWFYPEIDPDFDRALTMLGISSGSEGVEVAFLHDDIVESGLQSRFDLILDRGCFHALPPGERGEYVERAALLLETGGYLFLKCFSHRETMKDGPYRFTPEEIREFFSAKFIVLSIEETVFQGRLATHPKALFLTLKRR